jgi:hypothetical protein
MCCGGVGNRSVPEQKSFAVSDMNHGEGVVDNSRCNESRAHTAESSGRTADLMEDPVGLHNGSTEIRGTIAVRIAVIQSRQVFAHHRARNIAIVVSPQTVSNDEKSSLLFRGLRFWNHDPDAVLVGPVGAPSVRASRAHELQRPLRGHLHFPLLIITEIHC